MHPADFYTGIVADLYGPLKGFASDPEPCASFLREVGGRGLELGCGDGDPLIDLRLRGLDVEGVDSSADMLARCRRRAAEAGVEVTLHRQRMEALDLPGRYDAVFLAGPTFTQLSVLRYERRRGGESTVLERPWLLHWYTRHGFESLVEEAGLRVVSVTGSDGSPVPAAADTVDAGFRLQAVQHV